MNEIMNISGIECFEKDGMMFYFPERSEQYHNKIKQRIKAGELVGYRFEDNYPRIGECLVLEFATQPFRQPIRPHRYVEYVDILVDWRRKKCQ